eukprot:404601_1
MDDSKDEHKSKVSYPDEIADNRLENISIRELYNIHLKSIPSQQHNDEKSINSQSNTLYQLVLDIKHCIFKAGNDTKLLFSIYDHTEKRFVTEEYCLHLSPNNFPKIGSPEDCKVLFKNLSHETLKNDIYIVCRIYRIGEFQTPDVVKMNKRNSRKSKKKKKNKNKPIFIRPYGSSVIRLKQHVNELLKNIGKEINCEPSSAPIVMAKNEVNFTEIIFDLIE